MSLSFPEMFYKNSTKVLEGAEGIKNDLQIMLQIEKREQLGDPEFGVNLHKAKFKVNTSLGRELAVDGIVEAQNYVGNILFNRDDVQVSKPSAGVVDITIRATFSQAVNVRELLGMQGVNVNG